MKIRILFIALIIAALPVAAFAAEGGGGTNTTTYTTSTKTVYDTTNTAVAQQVDTFAVELIAHMQGGSALYDQTFNAAFADPTVQAALVTAQGVLTANGAASFLQSLLSTNTSLTGSVVQTGAPVVTGSDVSFVTTTYIGPQTIYIGDLQSIPFTIPPGGVDFDTLITSIIYQTITTTTTDTYLTKEVYELIGIPTATSVPEPGTLGSGHGPGRACWQRPAEEETHYLPLKGGKNTDEMSEFQLITITGRRKTYEDSNTFVCTDCCSDACRGIRSGERRRRQYHHLQHQHQNYL